MDCIATTSGWPREAGVLQTSRTVFGSHTQDHRHRLRTIKAYEYRDAATLLDDFWKTVDAVLREKGVIS